MARGRHIGLFGEAFPGTDHGLSTVVGQPTMVRMQGVPTMPGYRDRPGKWNAIAWPLILIEFLRQLIDRWL